MTDVDGVRLYSWDEVYAIIEKACDMGLDDNLDPLMTIGELDNLVNGSAN